MRKELSKSKLTMISYNADGSPMWSATMHGGIVTEFDAGGRDVPDLNETFRVLQEHMNATFFPRFAFDKLIFEVE